MASQSEKQVFLDYSTGSYLFCIFILLVENFIFFIENQSPGAISLDNFIQQRASSRVVVLSFY